jgi:hypothetical protein
MCYGRNTKIEEKMRKKQKRKIKGQSKQRKLDKETTDKGRK